MDSTKQAERVHIAFFGKTNVGKSSLINCVTSQNLSIVSDIKGTTTDPLVKSIEILPIGAAVVIDTAGLDDETELGKLRVKKTYEILNRTNIAVFVVSPEDGITKIDTDFINLLKSKNIPFVVVINKFDSVKSIKDLVEKIKNEFGVQPIATSAINNKGIEILKKSLSEVYTNSDEIKFLVEEFIKSNDIVVLVTPIDKSAPKGRMILPQVQMTRAILDCNAICITTKVEQLSLVLSKVQPALVICDSQVFKEVSDLTPKNIYLTSFSVLFARYKGSLDLFMSATKKIKSLEENDEILISEGCTHHRQCEDIGTVKIPKMLEAKLQKKFKFTFSSGHDFPEDLSKFKLVIHCGSCMLTRREVLNRIEMLNISNIPIINYGILIAFLQGIYDRSVEIFIK